MRVLLTGSSGRVGRTIYGALVPGHEVSGLDRHPFSTTRLVGDFCDADFLRRALIGVDAVIHTAALHAPHVGHLPDREFVRINVDGVQRLLDLALQAGVRNLVFTSTTAVYGYAIQRGACTWVDETTEPQPRTIYHRSKLQAEAMLESAAGPGLTVRVIRMSRCFPEPVDRMAVYRLHRGIDLRDVAAAHLAALQADGPDFQRYIASGATPFHALDLPALSADPVEVILQRQPDLMQAFAQRGWPLRPRIDRVYDASAIERDLGWRSRHGWQAVLAHYDQGSIEVLPFRA